MVSISEIQTFVAEIVLEYQPEKIYFFGSYANNRATLDSDINLFIIKDTIQKRSERNI